MFGALRSPDFRWWFASQVLAASGAMTQAIALSWLILQLSSNAVYLAVVTICAWGPLLPLGPWAGTLVDRVDRRRLLILTQSLQLAFALLLAALTATGSIRLWSVFAVSLATGVVAAVDGPARQVYVVDLVGTTGIASAVSLYEVVLNLSRVLGPAVGGVLLSTVGIAPCFLVYALSFLAPLAVLLRTKVKATGHKATAVRTPGAILAGLRYVRGAPPIRACILLAAAGGMLFNLGIALPLFATRALHLGSAGFGTLMAAFGVGALPGAALAAMTTWPTGRRVRVLAVATGLAVLLVASAPGAVVAFAGMAVAGFTSIWFIALANTLVQLDADPAMRGRVMGVWNMALPGTVPITGLLAAWVSQSLGSREGFAASGVALLLTVAVGWRTLGRHPGGTDSAQWSPCAEASRPSARRTSRT
jgi:MFS family permease